MLDALIEDGEDQLSRSAHVVLGVVAPKDDLMTLHLHLTSLRWEYPIPIPTYALKKTRAAVASVPPPLQGVVRS